MNEEAIQYGYELFTNDGYKGSIEEYKDIISKDKEALSHSYQLFRNDGYKDSIEDLSALLIPPSAEGKLIADSTESPLVSAQETGDLVTQEGEENINSDSLLQDASQIINPNEDIVKLYDEYKKQGALNIEEQAGIKKILQAQKEGKRSFWEKAEAYAEGWLRTGMPIPLYRYDKEEDLKEKREYAKKSNFLESLPNEQREELNKYAVNRSLSLSKESQNIIAENKILEEKSKSLVNQITHLIEAVERSKEEGKAIPSVLIEDYKDKKKELETISGRYNSNFDVIESNNEDIGNFTEELDLLKRNYTGVGYYKDLTRLTTSDMLSGIMEFGVSTVENMPSMSGVKAEFLEAEKFISDFREETNRQRGLIKPPMSVQDIESGADFGKWLAEQTAIQLPVITTLMASGGTAGLGLLGTSAAGSKIGELKDENASIIELISKKELDVEEMNKIIFERLDSGEKESGVEGVNSSIRVPSNEEMSLEDLVLKRDKTLKELEKLKEKPYGQSEIYLAGLGNGLTEILSERVSLGILSKGRRALKTVKNADLKQGISEYTKDLTKGLIMAGKDAGRESLSEFANTLSQNMIDILYLGKDDVHVFDGTIDALASGGAMGFGMSFSPTAIGIGSKAFTGTSSQNLLSKNSREIEGLTQELELGSETLNESTKSLLVKKINNLVKEQDKILTKVFDRVKTMERGDIETLIKLDTKANKILKAYSDISSSEMSAEVKTSMLRDLKEARDKVVKEKLEILEKNSDGTKVKNTVQESDKAEVTATPKNGTDEGAKGGTEVQREDGKESSLGRDGKGVQQSGVRSEGATPDGNVAEAKRGVIYEHPVTGKKATNKKELLSIKKGVEERVSELEGQKSNKINWDKSKARLLTRNKKILKGIEVVENQLGTIVENGVNEITVDDIPNINLSEKLGIDKLNDFLDKADESLKNYTKDTLGINLPIAVAQGAIKVMKVAASTAKTGADVISAGINYMRNTDWYKGLNDKDKQDAEKDFLNNIQNAKDEDKIKPLDKVDIERELALLTSGFPLVTYLDKKLIEPITKKMEEGLAKSVSKGNTSENKITRQVSQILTAWYNGLPRTYEQMMEKLGLTGKQELAYIKGAKITSQLQALINGDKESAKRVHSALDPEIYIEEERVEYDDLKDNEKQLFNELRKINNKTHEANYEMGFISKETYEKYKDSYIGRGYETYENIEGKSLEEKENFLSGKAFIKMYKQRKEIDEWKIENTVKDPIYLTINRMIHTERNAAVKAYSQFISRNVDLVSKKEKVGFTKLDGKAYGDLNGMYVVNYIAEDFKGYFYSNQILDALHLSFQLYDKMQLRQFYKKFHTVFSPAVQMGNLISNHAFAAAAGVNVISLWKGYPEASAEIKNKNGDFLKLVEAGILGTDILTRDLTLEKGMPSGLKIGSKEYNNWIAKKYSQADKWAQNKYSRSDDIMKLMAFKALKRSGLTEREAIQKTFESFQNYATVGKIWDTASKTPLVGNAYIKFQADLQRIMKNAVLTRPLTTATFFLGIKTMAHYTSAILSGESDEEREIREGRGFIPKIPLGFTNVPLTFKITGEKGMFGRFKHKEINLARYISPFYEYDNPNKSWQERVTDFMPLQIEQYEAEGGEKAYSVATPDVMIGALWSAFMKNRDFRGKTITDPNANKYVPSGLSSGEKIWNQLNYVFRSNVPLYSLIRDVETSIREGEDFYGRDKDFIDILVSTGIKVQTYDNNSYDKTIRSSIKSIEYKSMKIKDKLNGIRNQFKKDIDKLKTRLDEGKITPEKFEKVVQNKLESVSIRIESQTRNMAEQQSKLNTLLNNVQNYLDNKKEGGN